MAGPQPQPPPPQPQLPQPPQPQPPQPPQPQLPSTPPQPQAPQPQSPQPQSPQQQSSSQMPQPHPPQQPPHKKRSKAQHPLLAPIALAAIKARIARFISRPSLLASLGRWQLSTLCRAASTVPLPGEPHNQPRPLLRIPAKRWQLTHPRVLYRMAKTDELTKSIQLEGSSCASAFMAGAIDPLTATPPASDACK